MAGILKNIQEAVDPRNFFRIPGEIYRYLKNWRTYTTACDPSLKVKKLPIFFENKSATIFDPHYVFQAFWATERIHNFERQVPFHVDISSHLQFVVQVCAIRPTIQLEYRPPDIKINNLRHISGNILNLPFADRSIASITCLHVIEHIGLGRYGDPVDGDGCWRALSELKRITARDGSLMLSVPIGEHAVYFNAGYVFGAQEIVDYFSGFALEDFSYVDDKGNYFTNADIHATANMRSALGLFHFVNVDD
jgi:hypothetical protein